jgi:hypothetical protein
VVEIRWNAAGRVGYVGQSRHPKAKWVNTLHELILQDDDDLQVDCLYTMLKLNPSICQLDK